MNGIDKITQRIGADTQAEIDRILADAAAQAEAAAAAAQHKQRCPSHQSLFILMRPLRNRHAFISS